MVETKIGRVISSNGNTAKVELTSEAQMGMIVCLKTRGERVLARINRLESKRYEGMIGYITFLDYVERPVRTMTPIFLAEEDTVKDGIFFIGKDIRELEVKLPLNPLYSHAIVGGITRAGKTHLLLVLIEEMVPHGIPSIVIDPHGEFVNLPAYARAQGHPDSVVIVEDLRTADLIAYLQQRKIVVYNLLGLSKGAKQSRVLEILVEIMAAKEKDYQQANENPLLLNIPPVLIILDEADLFAPNPRRSRQTGATSETREAVVDIAVRGAKFGLGLVIATQRITRLELDVRSQCNTAMIFRLTDQGSINAVSTMAWIPSEDIQRIRALNVGQCLIAGTAVGRARIVNVRNIVTERAKRMDFAGMLGVKPPSDEVEFMPKIISTENGDLIDEATGKIVDTGINRLMAEDKAAYEKAGGDGVVLRSHISPEEKKILNQLRKFDKKKRKR